MTKEEKVIEYLRKVVLSASITSEELARRLVVMIEDKPIHMHTLNKQLVVAFCAFTKNYYKTGDPSTLSDYKTYGEFDHYTKANWQKLQYFGLIEKANGSSGWFPTTLGLRFYGGSGLSINRVLTKGGYVLPTSHENWQTRKKQPEMVYIYEIMESSLHDWRQKTEYQEDAKNHHNPPLI